MANTSGKSVTRVWSPKKALNIVLSKWEEICFWKQHPKTSPHSQNKIQVKKKCFVVSLFVFGMHKPVKYFDISYWSSQKWLKQRYFSSWETMLYYCFGTCGRKTSLSLCPLLLRDRKNNKQWMLASLLSFSPLYIHIPKLPFISMWHKMIYAAEVLARHTASKLLEKLLDSALCTVKMDLCTVEGLNRDDNLITDIATVI